MCGKYKSNDHCYGLVLVYASLAEKYKSDFYCYTTMSCTTNLIQNPIFMLPSSRTFKMISKKIQRAKNYNFDWVQQNMVQWVSFSNLLSA